LIVRRCSKAGGLARRRPLQTTYLARVRVRARARARARARVR
jgi:hypothetical protein